MYNRILFPTDGSDGATAALEHVLDIAVARDSTVHLLTVADTTETELTRLRGVATNDIEQAAERILSTADGRAQQLGVTTVTEVLAGEPYSEIVGYADAREIDLIVMPTHGRRGLGRFLLGSTTERVLRRSNVPVLTIRPDPTGAIEYPYRTILVPTDGSDCASQALTHAVEVATTEEADLHLLSVIATEIFGVDVRNNLPVSALEERANEALEDGREIANEAAVASVSTAVEYGPSVHRTVLSYIDEHDVDLVAVGTHGRTGFDRYVLGSVTEHLVRTSPIPVLAVREPTES